MKRLPVLSINPPEYQEALGVLFCLSTNDPYASKLPVEYIYNFFNVSIQNGKFEIALDDEGRPVSIVFFMNKEDSNDYGLFFSKEKNGYVVGF